MVSSQAVLENRYTERFREFNKTRSDRLRNFREEAFAYFAKNGFPTPRNENWKYTNVAPIGEIDWKIAAAALPTLDDGEGAAREILQKFSFSRDGFAALNAAFASPVLYRIARDTRLDAPIEITVSAIPESVIFPHVIVIAEPGSKATLIEIYQGQGRSFTDAAVQIVVEDNASLTHYRVQKESPEAFHVGTTEISLGRGSYYNSTNINLGGAIARHDIDLKFNSEGGEAYVDGLYMLNGSQHSDTHSSIDHLVPNCSSRQNYKGVLNDRSRAVFNGKVFVRENAHGTDAQQSNKNLLLSNDARVDTKPQLEIFNDDVKCSHGATVGQLDEEELFYLLTRGLPEPLARNLLTYGFAEEIINKIEIESIKTELDTAVLNRLQANLEG